MPDLTFEILRTRLVRERFRISGVADEAQASADGEDEYVEKVEESTLYSEIEHIELLD